MRRGAGIALLAAAAFPLWVWIFLRLGFFTPVFNLALGRVLKGTPLQVRVGSLRCDVFHFVEADDLVVGIDGRGGVGANSNQGIDQMRVGCAWSLHQYDDDGAIRHLQMQRHAVGIFDDVLHRTLYFHPLRVFIAIPEFGEVHSWRV